jgi:hypothetical protein
MVKSPSLGGDFLRQTCSKIDANNVNSATDLFDSLRKTIPIHELRIDCFRHFERSSGRVDAVFTDLLQNA